VAYGLAPVLADGGAMLPVLISEYSGDWDTGIARKAYGALWAALSADERGRLGLASRPSAGSIDADTVGDLLDRVETQLGRTRVLMLDQFDDYQLAHRERFLDRHRAWLTARQLAARKASGRWWTLPDAPAGRSF
jgi:hypothetical protein